MSNNYIEDKFLKKAITVGSAAFSILAFGFTVGKWYESEFGSENEKSSQTAPISISNSLDNSSSIQQISSNILPLLEQERLKNNTLVSANASLIAQHDEAVKNNNLWVEHDKQQKQNFSLKEQNYNKQINTCNANNKIYMDISMYEKSNKDINRKLEYYSHTLTSEQKENLKETLKSNDIKILALIDQYKKIES